MKFITINDSISLKDIKVYVCSPGLGKTHLADNNKNYVDVDRVRSNYKYGRDENYNIEDHEQNKGKNKSKAIKNAEEILEFSIDLIKSNIKNNKISLVAPNTDIVDKLNELNIPYLIVFADTSILEIIKNRMFERGNSVEFIEEMCGIDNFKKYYKKDMDDNRPYHKIIFNKDEYISDINKYISY